MTYVKNTWVDQQGQVRYTETEDGGYKIFTANYEEVTQLGTPVNADNMNHIEQGIYDCYTEIDTKINTLLQALYPVGSLYISTNSTNPLEALFGTWELVAANKALWTGNGTNANTTIAAGLPNITGAFNGSQLYDYGEGVSSSQKPVATGAFTVGGSSARYTPTSDGDNTQSGFKFTASNSSSIYGKSSTVQPPAYVVNVWRRTA